MSYDSCIFLSCFAQSFTCSVAHAELLLPHLFLAIQEDPLTQHCPSWRCRGVRGCIIEWVSVGFGRHLSELPPAVQPHRCILGCRQICQPIELSLPGMMPEQDTRAQQGLPPPRFGCPPPHQQDGLPLLRFATPLIHPGETQPAQTMQNCRHQAQPLPLAAVGRREPTAARSPPPRPSTAPTLTHSRQKQPTPATVRGVETRVAGPQAAQSHLSPQVGRRAVEGSDSPPSSGLNDEQLAPDAGFC